MAIFRRTSPGEPDIDDASRIDSKSGDAAILSYEAEHHRTERETIGRLDRDQATLEATAASIGPPDTALPLVADVARSDEVSRAVTTAIARFGGLDVLVNNAGIHFARPLDEYTDEEWSPDFSPST